MRLSQFKTTRQVSLKTILSVLILVALLPPMLLLAAALFRAAEANREAADSQFLDTATTLAGLVESAIDAHATIIRTLTVPLVSENPGAKLTAAKALDTIYSANLAMAEIGEIPADSARPWTISNLHDVVPGENARITMVTQVEEPSGPRTMAFDIDPRDMTESLRLEERFSDKLLIAVVDGNGRVIARSRAEAEFFGHAVPNWAELEQRPEATGVFNATRFEGDQVTFGFARLANTPGWAVVVGEPTAVFDARWREPLVTLVIGSVLAILFAIALALFVATRIARPIAKMTNYSRAIAQGARTPPAELLPSEIVEFEVLRHSHMAAQSVLVSRAEEMDLSRRRYRAVANAGAIVIWRRNPMGGLIDVEGWEALTGQKREAAFGSGWHDMVYPADHELIDNLRLLDSTIGAIDIEFRVQVPGERWHWVRMRGTRLLDSNAKTVEWVGTLEDINERKERELRIDHLAFHDILTGLPNRARLIDSLGERIADAAFGQTGALFYLDLDYFKEANDRYGHAAGDAVLCAVAERLNGLLRAGDLAARLGGDEFAVVVHTVVSVDEATMLAEQIVAALGAPYDYEGQMIEIGTSIGIALLDASALGVDMALSRADGALYRAKAAGRNTFALHVDYSVETTRHIA